MKNILQSKLVRSISGSIILKIIGSFLAFVTSIILARLLGVVEYGEYSYIIALIGLLSIPTNNGFPNMIIRFISAYKTRSEWSQLKGLLKVSNILALIISLSIFLVTLCIVLSLDINFDEKTIIVGLLLLPLLALNAVRTGILKGLNNVILGQMPENLIIPAVFIIILFLTRFIIGIDLDATTAIIIRVLTVGIAFLVGVLFLRAKIPFQVKNTKEKYNIKTWIHSAIPLLLVGGMMYLNNRFDILMLGVLKNSTDVGIYQVVTKGAELIIFALTALNSVFSPRFSSLYVDNKMLELQKMVTLSARLIFFISLPIALLFIFYGGTILSFFYGNEYAIGGTSLAILAFGQLVNAAFGSVGQLLIMTGYEKFNAFGVAVAAVSNIILNAILIPKWGIIGAATATSISLIVWNVLLAYGVYKKINIYPTLIGKIR
ncbi:flippase [Gracilibacillus salinarum]|uniref:Flippase n=1 Tax=Gracilibacillus salinarum TaxID=2932255 RepID=A0ABY4GRU8_9BACI|nr:flippase [Gracilibacillus salinarum]UOQ87009.1 flippase [Gracilibacillus salinarum]